MNNRIQRYIDFTLALIGLVLLFPVILILTIIGFFDTGSPIFRQKRLGQNLKVFTLLKFRTMKKSAPSVASHLVDNTLITRFGTFLRKTKLDELPQLWNVLKGEMSLVGPRPNLPTQEELIKFRSAYNVYGVKPGITGLAQLENIDMSTPEKLAKKDAQMIENLSALEYFKYLFSTVSGKGYGDAAKPEH